MKKLLLIALLFSISAWAKDKPVYRDALLVDFQTVNAGAHCSSDGQTTGSVSATGALDANTSTSTICRDTQKALYRVSIAGHIYTLTPARSAARTGAAFIPILGPGYLIATRKNSVLYGVLPGTHIEVGSEAGTFYVKVGKRESRYHLVGAE